MSTVLLDMATPRNDDYQLLPPVGRTVAESHRRYLTATTPWRARHGVFAVVLAVVSAVGGVACWYVASGEVVLNEQIPWLLGSVLSAVLFVVAGVYWLVVGARELRLGVVELCRDRAAVFELAPQPPQVDAGPTTDASATDSAPSVLVTVSGMRRSHRTDCLLVRGKMVQPLTAIPGELATCGVCQP